MKNLLSNIIAWILVIVGAINGYLQSIGTGEIDWFQMLVFVAGAVIAYLTGKTQNLKGKAE